MISIRPMRAAAVLACLMTAVAIPGFPPPLHAEDDPSGYSGGGCGQAVPRN